MKVTLELPELDLLEYLTLAAAVDGHSLSEGMYRMTRYSRGFAYKPEYWIHTALRQEFIAPEGWTNHKIDEKIIQIIEKKFEWLGFVEEGPRVFHLSFHSGFRGYVLTELGNQVLNHYAPNFQQRKHDWQVLFETQEIASPG